ncbi:hypothetical protein PT285_07040 [Lactobacillus sp. ESL0791]|nr:hypothetical protein [Lactobacillus sp. ESL0791]MDF7639154.1 hypothetical protein [Lactobacillus sp. ESL0791]
MYCQILIYLSIDVLPDSDLLVDVLSMCCQILISVDVRIRCTARF